MSRQPDIIVIETGGLALGSLGAYGCASAETPSFDRLASNSALFDSHYAASTDTREVETAHLGSAPSGTGPTLAEELAAAGYETVCLKQGDTGGEQRGFGFERILRFPAGQKHLADTIEETALYGFFSTMADLVGGLDADGKPLFFWASTVGLEGVWDFPLEHRALFVEDEEDPEPYAGTTPPSIAFPFIRDRRAAADEPLPDYDELCAAAESYAAGISLWDQGLEIFLAAWAGNRRYDNSCLVLTSPRGFPLGEHGVVGPAPEDRPLFYSEQFHLPLLISFPDKPAAAQRTNALTTPADLRESIAALAAGGSVPLRGLLDQPMDKPSDRGIPREYLLQKTGKCRGVITKDWILRAEEDPGGTLRRELYVLPDDRRQINDIARRCPDEAARLWGLLAK
ncbi:MAG: sulfatase-like hydrolase/transferase [Thermoguttaceae bacterium]|nr:sulfatase-like hydrolase/transferase [Thermoguttaceae bacterium]